MVALVLVSSLCTWNHVSGVRSSRYSEGVVARFKYAALARYMYMYTATFKSIVVYQTQDVLSQSDDHRAHY